MKWIESFMAISISLDGIWRGCENVLRPMIGILE
jgi:hypothetical protein